MNSAACSNKKVLLPNVVIEFKKPDAIYFVLEDVGISRIQKIVSDKYFKSMCAKPVSSMYMALTQREDN
jgi:hypothetical protein